MDIDQSGLIANGKTYEMAQKGYNKTRWQKFNERLMKYDSVNAADIKDILTVDNPNKSGSNIYSNRTIQT